MEKKVRFGKLTNAELNALLKGLHSENPEILVSSGMAEDCAAYRTQDIVVATTDPITAADADCAGTLAINVCANDIYASGGIPFAALVTLLLPTGATQSEVDSVMSQLVSAAAELHVDIIGGHTEYTDAVTRTVISTTMLGHASHYVSSRTMRAGDRVYCTKHLALEGTAILAADTPHLTTEEVAIARGYLTDISVRREGEVLSAFPTVTAMHDITEGGIIGALAEMCEAANVGAVLYRERCPLTDITLRLVTAMQIDALRLISSGSMLYTVSDDGTAVAEALSAVGIPTTYVGDITADGGLLLSDGGTMTAVTTEPDRLFGNCTR